MSTKTLFRRIAESPCPWKRKALFTAYWLFDSPNYFVGALVHGRLWHYEFWDFTWKWFWLTWDGYWVEADRK